MSTQICQDPPASSQCSVRTQQTASLWQHVWPQVAPGPVSCPEVCHCPRKGTQEGLGRAPSSPAGAHTPAPAQTLATCLPAHTGVTVAGGHPAQSGLDPWSHPCPYALRSSLPLKSLPNPGLSARAVISQERRGDRVKEDSSQEGPALRRVRPPGGHSCGASSILWGQRDKGRGHSPWGVPE